MNRKGALELGINTIVILVIAMVVIAAGIAFIRGFFQLGEEKLKEPFNLADFGLKPSSTDPLVMQSGDVTIKRGNEKEIKVGYYNKENTAQNSIDLKMGVCKGRDNAGTEISVTPVITTVPVTEIKAGDSVGMRVLLRAKSGSENINSGTYICPIILTVGGVDYASVQFTMTVTS